MPQPTMLDLAPSLQEPGKRLVDTGELKLLFASLMDVILNAAATGTNAATAAPLPSGGFLWVTSSPAIAAGFLMPQGALGQQVRIYADTVSGITLYAPPGGGLVDLDQNSTSASATLIVGGGQTATLVCLGPGVWNRVS